jgi:hypothetical protein
MHEPLRQTSELIGCKPVSTERFVRDAIEWLALHTDSLDIVRTGPAWCVSGDDWTGTADTLPLALAAAIQSHHTARLMSVERNKPKGG